MIAANSNTKPLMTPGQRLLWQKIAAFKLDDDDSAFKFSERLARENGWTKNYALRVIEEYRKFIFLCCVTEVGVTPSDPVDQAWHLHLTYTKSYWIDLCRNILEREIHHNPTKGGNAEAQKFDSFYTSSRQQYMDLFGMEPPVDIWQDNHTRFGDIDFQRVNLQKYWLFKKPRFKRSNIIQLNLVALVAFVSFELVSEIFTVFAVIGVVIGGCWMMLNHERNAEKRGDNNSVRNDEGNGCNSGCSTDSGGHHGHGGHHGDSGCSSHSGDSGCSSGCSGCGSGCGGGGD